MERKEIYTELDALMPLFRERLAAGQNIKFSPRGTSMLPMLRPGIDAVVLSPAPEKLKKYDLPLYQRADGKYILHRIVSAGQTYTCIGDNQFHLEPGIGHGQIIAVVTAFNRNNREISVNDPGYLCYCCLWHYSRPLRHVLRRIKNRLRRILKK